MAEGIEPKPFSDDIITGSYTPDATYGNLIFGTSWLIKKMGKLVIVNGEILTEGTSLPDNTKVTIATIDAGFRPLYRQRLSLVITDSGTTSVPKGTGMLSIDADGTVKFIETAKGFTAFSVAYFI